MTYFTISIYLFVELTTFNYAFANDSLKWNIQSFTSGQTMAESVLNDDLNWLYVQQIVFFSQS